MDEPLESSFRAALRVFYRGKLSKTVNGFISFSETDKKKWMSLKIKYVHLPFCSIFRYEIRVTPRGRELSRGSSIFFFCSHSRVSHRSYKYSLGKTRFAVANSSKKGSQTKSQLINMAQPRPRRAPAGRCSAGPRTRAKCPPPGPHPFIPALGTPMGVCAA